MPHRVAVVFGEHSYTYAAFDQAVNQAAHALRAAGLRRGDRMLLMSGNSDQFMLALYAALRLGALIVPVNPASAAPELQHILGDSGASLLVFGGGTQNVIRAADSFLHGALTGPPIALDPVQGYRNLGDLAADRPTTPPGVDVAESDDALILYTSGTTGRPKGALFDHHRILWVGINTSLMLGLRDGDRILHVAPMYHAAELAMLVCGGTLVGATHVVLPSFAPQTVLDALEQHRCAPQRLARALCQRTVACAGRPGGHHDGYRGSGPVRVMGGSRRGGRTRPGHCRPDPGAGRWCRRGSRPGPAHRRRPATLVVRE